MLALTTSAVDAVRRVLSSESATAGLRIMVATGGCNGLQYRLGLETEAQDGDTVLTFGDVTVYVDSDSHPLLQGAEIDFVEDVSGAGFVFHNPNAKAKCGCGKSFC